jgi:uncharacterized protein
MRCPRCETALLDERERDGVVIDACPSCRGVWLDRGELEKLIARAARDRDDHHRDDHDDRYRHPRRKRSFFESLGEIFD